MKTTSLLALALVALGMTAQASANAATSAAGSADMELVDKRCLYTCERQGRKNCLRICNRPHSSISKVAAAEPATLHKRDYQCYRSCISRCHGDSKCKDQCAWDCAGPVRPRPPAKRDTASIERADGCEPFRASCRWSCRGNRDCIDRCNDLWC